MPENDVQYTSDSCKLCQPLEITVYPDQRVLGRISRNVAWQAWERQLYCKKLGQVAASVSKFVSDGFQLSALGRVDCGQVRFWKSSPEQDGFVRSEVPNYCNYLVLTGSAKIECSMMTYLKVTLDVDYLGNSKAPI